MSRRAAARADGARVTTVGSADAFNSAGRGNACTLVEDAEGAFCVDFGPTALMGLKRLGHDPAELDAVFLTHLHGDHFGGLHLLLIDAQYRARRSRPLLIAGPPGTRRRIEAWYALAFGRAAKRRPFETRYLEWPPATSAALGRRRVRTWAADHMQPREGALHLRVRTSGVELAFSGDTGWSEGLIEAAAGADLLVCECTDYGPPTTQHLGWQALRPRLPQLTARRILLVHQGEEVRRRSSSLQASRVRFAEDGTTVRVRPGKR